MSPRRLLFFAAIVLAVVLRVVYFHEIRASPFFLQPIFDARDYLSWAHEITHGKLVWDVPKLYPPGYPYFLALVSKLTGDSIPLMTEANAVLGVGWIVLLVLATRRLFPWPTAEISGLVAASYWVFFHFEAHLVGETLFIFLDVLALFLLTRKPGASRVPLLFLAAGLVLGLASITRPNSMATFPFLLPLVAAPRDLARPAARPAALRRLLPFALGFALVLAPVVIRTHQITGLWAVRHHLALNLYAGNRPGAPGYHSIRPGRAWDRLSAEPERVAGARTLVDHERYFTRRVMEFARSDPGGFLRLQFRKLALFLNVREIRDIMDPRFFDRYAPLQASRLLPDFGWVGPPALVGLFLALRGAPVPWLLYAFALPQAASVIATVIGTRYRLPVVPFLIPFAAYAFVRLFGWIKAGRFAPAGATAVALALAALLVHHRFPDLQRDTFSEEFTRVAFVEEERGDISAAASSWGDALAADSQRADTWVGCVDFALRNGDAARALAASADALTRFPNDADLWALRGRAFLYSEQPDSARAALETALAKQPDHLDALADLGRAQFDAGQLDASVETFRHAVRLDLKRTDLILDAARVLFESAKRPGHDDERRAAVGLLQEVLRRDPNDEIAQSMLRAETPPR